jgi:hypothetical protein
MILALTEVRLSARTGLAGRAPVGSVLPRECGEVSHSKRLAAASFKFTFIVIKIFFPESKAK